MSAEKPYVFRTAPLLVPKVWGGRRLAEYCGKALGPGRYGESWEVADLEEGQSRVDTGPAKGRALGEVTKAWGADLVGSSAEGDRFPLLLKLLDAEMDLSVQVHPGPKDLKRMPGAQSKDEAWFVLSSEEGEIIHGLSQDGMVPGELRVAVEAGEVERFLERHPVRAGDVVRVPPGTIHAICGGVLLLEIQEPSDTTYRFYDYRRPGLDGEPRELHLEKALEVARLMRSLEVFQEPVQIGDGLDLLVESPSYRVERLASGDGAELRWAVGEESVQLVHALGGEFAIGDGIGGRVKLLPFQTAVIPAATETVDVTVVKPGALLVLGLSSPRGLVRELMVRERTSV